MCIIDTGSYQELSLILTVIYFATAIQCFVGWFKRFRQDTSLSDAEKRLCWQVLAIATIFWPIVLPISSLEKRIVASPAENLYWR